MSGLRSLHATKRSQFAGVRRATEQVWRGARGAAESRWQCILGLALREDLALGGRTVSGPEGAEEVLLGMVKDADGPKPNSMARPGAGVPGPGMDSESLQAASGLLVGCPAWTGVRELSCSLIGGWQAGNGNGYDYDSESSDSRTMLSDWAGSLCSLGNAIDDAMGCGLPDVSRRLEQVRQAAGQVMQDVGGRDYSSIEAVLLRFAELRSAAPEAYAAAFVSEALPELLRPYVDSEVSGWVPSIDHCIAVHAATSATGPDIGMAEVRPPSNASHGGTDASAGCLDL